MKKTKRNLLLFIVSVVSGFLLSSADYFSTSELSSHLQANTLSEQPTAKILPGERYRYALVDDKDKTIHLNPNVQKEVKLKIKNTGKFSWDIKSKALTTKVDPAKTIDLKFNVASHANPGFYTETIKPIIADSNWTINNKIDLGIIVDGDFDKSYQYELLNRESLSLMNKSTKHLTLKVKNTGTSTWFNHGQFPLLLTVADKSVASDFKPNDNSWLADDVIANMDEDEVAPGQVATFNFNMTAPAYISNYEFKFNLAIKDNYILKTPFILEVNIISKTVALTFDDGYGDIGAFVDLLSSQNVRGTFFMLGCVAEKNPEAMRKIVNEGHLLANHSYCHPDFRTLTADGIRWQLNRTREIMSDVTDKDIYPYFRYPYGGMNDFTNNVLREDGWKYFPWTQDTSDYRYHPNTDAGRRHIYTYATLNPPDNAIVLMHTISQSSLATLPDIIQWYRDHGYSFVTVDQL